MANKEHSDTKERIETLNYAPSLQNTGDLEAGTHTIVPTSRPAIGSAQYSQALTLPKPDDVRLVVKRIAARLSVNIAGLGTATHVYCSVRVDVDDADHELFNEDWDAIGAKLDAVDTWSGAKSDIFDLLKDGAAHTFYFLFWADAASQATIDVVQLWEGVGSCATSSSVEIWKITCSGFMEIVSSHSRIGTGATTFYFCPLADIDLYDIAASLAFRLYLVYGYIQVRMRGSVATDLNYVSKLKAALRSEQ